MRTRLTLVVSTIFSAIASFAVEPAVVWWHFNGTDGEEAPSSVTDTSSTYELTRYQYAPSGVTTFTPQSGQDDSFGTVAYWGSGESPVTATGVAGAIQLFRYQLTDGVPGRRYGASYCLSGAEKIKAVLPANDAGELLPFTIELMMKIDPYDEATCGSAKNMCVMALTRDSRDSRSDTVFKLNFISTGNLFLQCESKSGGNGDVCSQSISGDLVRDGKWHHLALVYTLDVDAEPHQGRMRIYLDYGSTPKIDYTFAKSETVRSLRYLHVVSGADAEPTKLYLSVGELSGDGGALRMDEMRITTAALGIEDFVKIGTPEKTNFFFPLGVKGDLTRNLTSAVQAEVASVTQDDLRPVASLSDGVASWPCSVSAGFGPQSAFSVSPAFSAFLAYSDFTSEFSFKSSSSSAQTLLAHGSQWSLTLTDGALAWNHGEGMESIATGLADDAWHRVALVYEPTETDASYTVYVDGTAHRLSDDVKLPDVVNAALQLGASFEGNMLGFRARSEAVSPSALLSLAEPTPLILWPFSTSVAMGSAIGTTTAADGNPRLKLTSGITGTSTGATEANRPVWSNDVPAKCIWNAVSGKVLNPDNRSSAFFHNTGTYNESTKTWDNGNGGGYLVSSALGNLGDSYTIEFFVKPTHTFSGNMTCLCDIRMDDNSYIVVDAYQCHQQNIKLRIPTDISDQNRHIGYASKRLTAGEWHHVAVTVDCATDPEMLTITSYVDYSLGASLTTSAFSKTAAISSIKLGSGNGKEFDGLMDEFRITRGVLTEDEFMREFPLRTDLTSVWLLDDLTGAEYFHGNEFSYLNGTFAPSAAEVTDARPFPSTTYRANGKRVASVSKSVAFNGRGGLSIPCAAIAGADDFTFEATVRGTGTVARKSRNGGASWSFGIGEDGKPAMRFDVGDADFGATASTVSAVGENAVDTSAWHHIALVCNRASSTTAMLYVDGVQVATATDLDLRIDDGDLVVADGFTGDVSGVRFSASALAPTAFMMAQPSPGFMIILR